MSKLLAANFIRLVKSKIFWVANLFMAGYSIFIYAMAAKNATNGLQDINWNLYLFNDMIMMGFVMAIFTSFFFEAEYRDGVIRNKIAVGHTRYSIYFANFITCVVAGLIFMTVYAIVSTVAGSLLVGSITLSSVVNVGWSVGSGVLIMMVYAAIFVAIAMVDSNKARSAAISLLIAMILLVAGFVIYTDLQQPELTSRAVLTETGELKIEENIPNSRYVSGTKRVIWKALALILPSVQSMQLIDMDGEFSVKMIVTSIVVIAIICSFGMCVFKKKDIK